MEVPSCEGRLTFRASFLTRCWFTRMWTIQEIALAGNCLSLQFLIGTRRLSYLQVLRAAIECPATDMQSYQYHYNAMLSLQLYLNVQEQQYGRFTDIFVSAFSRESSDPRDKIFAMFGLIHTIDPTFTRPDYSRSVVSVYVDAALWTLVKMEYLGLLYYSTSLSRSVEHQHRMMTEELPSWVPDFSLFVPNLPRNFYFFHHPTAAKNSPQEIQVLNHRRVLQVKGILFSTLTGVADPFLEGPMRYFSQDLKKSILVLLQTWIKLWNVGLEEFQDFFTSVEKGARDNDNVPVTNTFATFLELVAKRTKSQEHVGSNEIPSGTEALIWLEAQGPRFDFTDEFFCDCSILLEGSRAIKTEDGKIGIAEGNVQTFDRIALVPGMRWPLVLRPLDDGYWKLVGRAYVHGIMKGEAWPKQDNESLLEDILLK